MTPEQASLLEKARRSLEGAKLLLKAGYFDFAASRAYYAMFHLAEALLRAGLDVSKHSAVNAAFGKHLAKTGLLDSCFHRYLLAGERTRIRGDYDPQDDVTEAEAREEIAHFEEFTKAAEAYLT